MGSALVGTFLGAFNNSVAGVAITDVLRDYPRTNVSRGAWFLTGYMFATALCLPLAGRLIDFKGARSVYLTGAWIFGMASLLCALAPSFEWLIVGRVVQGVAAAPVLPIVFMTISNSFPRGERGKAMGIWASTNAASLAAGPLLGGAIVQFVGWRFIFWASVPLAILVFLAAYIYLPDYGRGAKGRFDVPGALLMTISLCSLMVALSKLEDWGVFTLPVGSLILGAALLMWLYSSRSRRLEHPFFDLRLFSNSTYSLINMLVGLQMMILFGLFFTVPLLLVYLTGTSQFVAGLVVSVMTFMGVILGPASGQFAERRGSRLPLMLAGVVLCLGSLILAVFMDLFSVVVAGLVLMGAGMALVQSPAALTVATHLDSAWSGVAIGAYNTVRFLSGVAGAAIFATAFESIAGVRNESSLRQVSSGMLKDGFRAVFIVMIAAGILISVIARALPRGRTGSIPEGASGIG